MKAERWAMFMSTMFCRSASPWVVTFTKENRAHIAIYKREVVQRH
jgi:hypothetical protein